MLQGWVVIVVALGYLGLLFVIASYGDRMPASAAPRAAGHLRAVARDLLHLLDLLRLGRPRLALRLDFLPIYVGPILVFGLRR